MWSVSSVFSRPGAVSRTAIRLAQPVGHPGRSRGVMANALRSIYVKGDPVGGKLGDCPFCHRALLMLELKGLEYDKMYVDFSAKPEDLFVDNPDGKVPVLLDSDVRVPDSGAICNYLDEKYPDGPSLGNDSIPGVGEKLFPSFVQLLKASPEDLAEKEPALLEQLQQINDYLEGNGPFLNGSEMGAADAMMLPRLYHLSVALPHFKQWQVPERFPAVQAYMKLAKEHPAFLATDYGKQMIISGWLDHGVPTPADSTVASPS